MPDDAVLILARGGLGYNFILNYIHGVSTKKSNMTDIYEN